jgi:hypothetical protein
MPTPTQSQQTLCFDFRNFVLNNQKQHSGPTQSIKVNFKYNNNNNNINKRKNPNWVCETAMYDSLKYN